MTPVSPTPALVRSPSSESWQDDETARGTALARESSASTASITEVPQLDLAPSCGLCGDAAAQPGPVVKGLCSRSRLESDSEDKHALSVKLAAFHESFMGGVSQSPEMLAAFLSLWTGGEDGQAATCSHDTVWLNVYYISAVALDEGRRFRRLPDVGGDGLGLGQRFFKNVIGIYHVGVEVHGTEYTFGTYSAQGSRQLGPDNSGVCSHSPRKPGPRYIFKESVMLGQAALTAAEIDEVSAQLGQGAFAKSKYDKVHNNCVDFADSLAGLLRVSHPPGWCRRGADIARRLNLVSCRPQAADDVLVKPGDAAVYEASPTP